MAIESQNLRRTVIGRIEILYNAGQVKRMHTVPTLGNHSIAEHVYGSLVLAYELCALNKIDSAPVVRALLYHDAAEVMTGDVPAPVKRKFPKVKEAFEEMEKFFDGNVGLDASPPTEFEYAVIKACDTLDLMFNVLREFRFGNRHPDLKIVWDNCLSYIQAQYHVAGVDYLVANLLVEAHDVLGK